MANASNALFMVTPRRQAPYRIGSGSRSRFLLRRPRGAGDGADHRPVVLVDDHRLLRLRPEIDGNVVHTVAEDSRLDGQVAHALAEALLAADGAPLHHHT